MYSDYSIYIHIPFCKKRCSYCGFSSCTDFSSVSAYFDKLFEEIDRYADPSKPIYTVYLGGGTPSSVPTHCMDALFAKLRSRFDMSQLQEMTVECNPESASAPLLECLMRNGVNRLSFGLQSVNDATLRKMGRLHTYADFVAAVDRAKAMGFDNLNADLILGIDDNAEQFLRSVQTATDLPLSHISVYALELHEGTPLYRQLDGTLPLSDDDMADMYDMAVAVLAAHGFARYEISNFAQTGRQCKHNLHYWQEGRYFAFGASAAGFVGDVRFTNCWDVDDYLRLPVDKLRAESSVISLSEQANECAMLGLRLQQGLSLSQFALRYGKDFFTFFDQADRLRQQGFLAVDGDFVHVPSDKFYVLNSILTDLLQLD